jgi:hypothetical protein
VKVFKGCFNKLRAAAVSVEVFHSQHEITAGPGCRDGKGAGMTQVQQAGGSRCKASSGAH